MPRPSSSNKGRLLKLPVLQTGSLKVAELSARCLFGGAQAFPAARWQEMSEFGPNVIAGAGAELQRLMERIDLGTLDLPTLDHAIFVLTELGDKPLSDATRVTLWQRFGVPVYELYLGPNRQMLAHECEALEGWHVEPGAQFFLRAGHLALQTPGALYPTGLKSTLETTPCPCGRPGMRIVAPGTVTEGVSRLAAGA